MALFVVMLFGSIYFVVLVVRMKEGSTVKGDIRSWCFLWRVINITLL
jgi:hypothetical protein